MSLSSIPASPFFATPRHANLRDAKGFCGRIVPAVRDLEGASALARLRWISIGLWLSSALASASPTGTFS
jgi:hypothetical protein